MLGLVPSLSFVQYSIQYSIRQFAKSGGLIRLKPYNMVSYKEVLFVLSSVIMVQTPLLKRNITISCRLTSILFLLGYVSMSIEGIEPGRIFVMVTRRKGYLKTHP